MPLSLVLWILLKFWFPLGKELAIKIQLGNLYPWIILNKDISFVSGQELSYLMFLLLILRPNGNWKVIPYYTVNDPPYFIILNCSFTESCCPKPSPSHDHSECSLYLHEVGRAGGGQGRLREVKNLPEADPCSHQPKSLLWAALHRWIGNWAAEIVIPLGHLPLDWIHFYSSFAVKEGLTDLFSYIKMSICSSNRDISGILGTKKRVASIIRNNLEHIARKALPPNSTLWFDGCEFTVWRPDVILLLTRD